MPRTTRTIGFQPIIGWLGFSALPLVEEEPGFPVEWNKSTELNADFRVGDRLVIPLMEGNNPDEN